MILFDTETTGLVGPSAMPIAKQPYIIELCAVRLNDKTLKEEEHIDVLINPGVPISAEITRITGIKEEDVKGKPPFAAYYDQICELFLGQRMMVAHNCDFDSNLMMYDLRRIGKEHRFPWPPRRLCTVEASLFIKGHRLKLGELYEHCTGRKLVGAHRAINDVRAMADCVRWLVKNKKI